MSSDNESPNDKPPPQVVGVKTVNESERGA